LHVIDKDNLSNLAKEQKKRAFQIKEFFDIEGIGYYFNGQQNVLVVLKENSIAFSDMFKKKYKKILDLENNILAIIDNYRKLHNQIHLPGDAININHKVEKIFDFINEEIVKHSNILVAKYDLPPTMLLSVINFFLTKNTKSTLNPAVKIANTNAFIPICPIEETTCLSIPTLTPIIKISTNKIIVWMCAILLINLSCIYPLPLKIHPITRSPKYSSILNAINVKPPTFNLLYYSNID